MKQYPMITISRQYGTDGHQIAEFLAENLGIPFYDKDLISIASRETRFAEKAFDEAEKSDRAKERMAWYNTFMTRPSGAHWKEAALGLQQIMGDYAAAGPYRVRSETLLDAGLKYLGDLRRDAEASVRAANAHELLRTVEAFELMDNGEAIMHAARERRESRGMHLRSDYTFTNPLLNDKFLTVRRENGRVVTEWRPRRSA